MQQGGAFHNLFGPAEDAARLFWRSNDNIFKGVHPFAKSAMRLNFEYAAFAMRQTRTAMDLTSTVSRSRSPLDAASSAMSYWMSAFEDLARVNSRAMMTWGQALPNAAATDAIIDDWHSRVVARAEDLSGEPRIHDHLDLKSASRRAAEDVARAAQEARNRVAEAA